MEMPYQKNLALIVAYDGTEFYGWQKTSTGPSIEGTLQVALEQILQEKIVLQASSRTDTGVHADKQVVNFHTSRWSRTLTQLMKSLNALLPSSIRILNAQEMPSSFHPTLHALGKEYHYQLCYAPVQLPKERAYVWHTPGFLDLAAMTTAASYLVGEQDFSAFCNTRKNLTYSHKRRFLHAIHLDPSCGQKLSIRIIGNQFLYKMVRNLVGILIDVGRHKQCADSIPIILASQQRSHAGMTAPALGLTLHTIFFPREISSILSLPLYDYA